MRGTPILGMYMQAACGVKYVMSVLNLHNLLGLSEFYAPHSETGSVPKKSEGCDLEN